MVRKAPAKAGAFFITKHLTSTLQVWYKGNMLEIEGNIWDFKSSRTPICIPTNGFIKNNGENVMGRGIALQAKQMYPELPGLLGERLHTFGNRVFYFSDYDLITFPSKHVWWDASDPDLIRISGEQLVELTKDQGFEKVYLTRPGCGNGRLTWEVVRPIIAPILKSDNFIVVQN